MRTPSNRTTQATLLLTGLLGLAGGLPVTSENAVTPEEVRYGWAGPGELDPDFVSDHEVEFQISGAAPGATSEGAKVYLWTFAKAINGGQNFPASRQAVGDCVSFGAAHAVNYLQATTICRDISFNSFRPAFPPYIYGISRVQVGKGRLGGSDGSVGEWAAEGLCDYGVYPSDDPGAPPYSGTLARQWGRSGPPANVVQVGKQFLVKSYAPIRSYEEARDALANGYPITVASNQGFANGREVEQSGVLWGVASGSWNHQMSLIGVDDTLQAPDGSKGGLYCLNSWGAAAHKRPIRGEPEGGFWISSKRATIMLRQDDSWAFSGFEGFPALDQTLDLTAFRMNVEIPEQPPGEIALSEFAGVPPDLATTAGASGVAAAGAMSVRRRRRTASPTTVA